MKNIFVLIVIFFCSCRTIKPLDDKYNAAKNFLRKDLGNDSFYVVDTLVYISQVNWFKDKQEVNKDLAQLDSLENLDEKYFFKNEYYPFNKEKKDGINNVYFSKPIKNVLDVEVISNKGNRDNSYKYLTSFNTSVLYRFTFNESNKIINVVKEERIYN